MNPPLRVSCVTAMKPPPPSVAVATWLVEMLREGSTRGKTEVALRLEPSNASVATLACAALATSIATLTLTPAPALTFCSSPADAGRACAAFLYAALSGQGDVAAPALGWGGVEGVAS